eukprot:6802405-Alexandrium_andersonii.AAC.1
MANRDLLARLGAHTATLATHSAQTVRVARTTPAKSDSRPKRGRLGLGHLAGATRSSQLAGAIDTGAPSLRTTHCRRRHSGARCRRP